MIRYCWIILIAYCSCESSNRNQKIISDKLRKAIESNDTALAKKIAQQELNNMRSSIRDSSFAATMDASLEQQAFEFKIQKGDTSFTDVSLKKMHAVINKLYAFALEKSKQQEDVDYYSGKIAMSDDLWMNANFRNKTKKELQIFNLLLNKDIFLASCIINDADPKEIIKMKEQARKSYEKGISILK